MRIFLQILAYLVGAPIVGGILSGLDRRFSARLQGRVGPPILQPFYDVLKLLEKEDIVVRRSQNFYIWFFLMVIIFTGALFFSGGNLLLVVFAFALGSIFFVLAGYKASSPYSFIGAQRELIQIAAYEPAMFFTAIGLYMVTRSFEVNAIAAFPKPLIIFLPGVFFSLAYILIIKLRKSPFDISTSHHAHQEVVKGITTEFSGKALAAIEVAHWYETVIILGFVYLFCASNAVAGVLLSLAAFFAVIFIDNSTARAKWQMVLFSSWLVTLVLSVTNISVLFYLHK
jgi:formate hydrogenlyase subunit 4